MSTILFIGVLIAITYALTSSSKAEKPKKKKTMFENFGSSTQSSSGQRSLPVDKGEMLRCHNCGAFFPESRAVRTEVQDLELHFCSQNCKVNFRVP